MDSFPRRVQVFDVSIDPYTMDESVARADEFIRSGSFAHFIGINADKIIQMNDDPEMKDIVKRCEMVNADGASMLIAAKRLGVSIPERVTGIDLMYRLCELAQKKGYSIFLFGAKPQTVEKTKDRLREEYPEIRIAGTHNGYFSEDEFGDVAEFIRSAHADIIFVGITSPKKERIIERFRSFGFSGIYVGVGGAFDVVSGEIPRAPDWMQRLKFEWLFRMIREPRRLLKRYVVGNARFIHLLYLETRVSRGSK